jgi:hypothetical protein
VVDSSLPRICGVCVAVTNAAVKRPRIVR